MYAPAQVGGGDDPIRPTTRRSSAIPAFHARQRLRARDADAGPLRVRARAPSSWCFRAHQLKVAPACLRGDERLLLARRRVARVRLLPRGGEPRLHVPLARHRRARDDPRARSTACAAASWRPPRPTRRRSTRRSPTSSRCSPCSRSPTVAGHAHRALTCATTRDRGAGLIPTQHRRRRTACRSRCCSGLLTTWTRVVGGRPRRTRCAGRSSSSPRPTRSSSLEFEEAASPRRDPGRGDHARLRRRLGPAPRRARGDADRVHRAAPRRRGGRRRGQHAAHDGDPRARLHAARAHRVRRLPERDDHRRQRDPRRRHPLRAPAGLLDWFAQYGIKPASGQGRRPLGRRRASSSRARACTSAASRRTASRCSGSSGPTAQLNLAASAYTRIASLRPCVRTSPDDGLPLRETVAECIQYVKIRASELGPSTASRSRWGCRTPPRSRSRAAAR